VRLAIERAFRFDDIQRLELNVYAWNIPAVRTYQRLGFGSQGVRRSSTKLGDQCWDTAIMGLLRDERNSAIAAGREPSSPGATGRLGFP
jgi:RimJ/RimL family protein N-acetyltransferase